MTRTFALLLVAALAACSSTGAPKAQSGKDWSPKFGAKALYEKTGLLRPVNGVGSLDEVFARIQQAIGRA